MLGSTLESKIIVNSVMRKPVWASINDTVLSIAEQMVNENIGAVVIMKENIPVGIITESDIVKSFVCACARNKDPAKTRAEHIMSSPLITIDTGKSIIYALKLMCDRGIRRLVVVSPQRILVGIITQRRLLEALI
jgi:predicted transcriptional regulator